MRCMMQSGSACEKSQPVPTGCEPRSWQHTRRGRKRMPVADDAIRCDACPVLCYIKPGRAGACDRYANADGQLVRLDPHVVLERAVSRGDTLVPFLEKSREWDGALLSGAETFVTAIGAGTTYPDYKPAPFIISSEVAGVDMVTVVTEGIFSYCGVKLKIDTDRHLGAACRKSACALAAARPQSACLRSSGLGRWMRSWWWTITSPACCQNIRRESCW